MLFSVGTFYEFSTIRYPMSFCVLAQNEGEQSAKGRTINDLGGPQGREFVLSFFFPGQPAVEFFSWPTC